MAIQAQMHDGTVLEFPDGTPDDVINKAAQSFIGEQPKQAGALSQAGDLTQVATKGGLSGFVGAIPDLWLQGLGALERMSEGEPDVVGARHPVSRAQMNLPPELRQGGIKPVPENAPAPPSITEALYKGMGGTENTPLEKAVKTGTQYLGSGMTFGGGLSKPNVLAGLGGGVGSYSDDPMMSPMLAMAFGFSPSAYNLTKKGFSKLSPTAGVNKKIQGLGIDPTVSASEVGGEVQQYMDDALRQSQRELSVTSGAPYSAPVTQAQMGQAAQAPLQKDAVSAQTQANQLRAINQKATRGFTAPYGSTPERAGQGVVIQVEKARKALEPLRQEVAGAIGNRPTNLADDITANIRSKFNPSRIDEELLVAFDEDVAARMAKNAAAGSPQNGITEADFNALMGQYKNDPKMQMIIQNQFGKTVEKGRGFLTFDDLTELSDKYFGKDLTSKLLYGHINKAKKALAGEAGVAEQFDKYNSKYSSIMNMKRGYITGSENSGVFRGLMKQGVDDPIAFSREVQAIPAGERQDLFKTIHRELGGGNTYSEEKWAEAFRKLSPDSQMAFANEDPRLYEQMRKAADDILANQINIKSLQTASMDSFATLNADEAGIKLVKMAQQQPTAFTALIGKSDEAGRQIIADGLHSSLGAKGDIFDFNQWAEGFKKLPASTKIALAGSEQRLQELTNMADDILSKSQQLEQVTDTFGKFLKVGKQEAADKMVTTIQRNPEMYRQYMKLLPEQTQNKIISLAHKDLGGGNTFDIEKWGKGVQNLDPDSLLALAKDDPKMAEQLIKIAEKAEGRGAFVRNVRGILNTASFGISHKVGYATVVMGRLLANKNGVAALSGIARVSDKNFPNAMKSLTGRLTDIVREIENEGAVQPTNPQPSEPVAPPVTPERDVPNIPLYNQKQEAGQGDYLKTLAQVENAGRDTPDKNPNSSATGKYQIANDTWAGLQENYPEKFRGKDKNDPTVQEEATLVLQKESDDAITAAGLTPDDDTRSFVHFLGETDARKLLPKLNSKISAAKLAPRAAKSNPEYFYEKLPNGKRRERTPKEVFEYRKMKMSKAENEIQLARK